MEVLRDSIPMVSLAMSASILYARLASARLRPGGHRAAALLPVIAVFVAIPFSFSSAVVRGIAAFFLAWLGTFKVALLGFGRGPLDPSLPLPPFLFTAALPVKLSRSDRPVVASKSVSVLSCAIKAAVIAAILQLYKFKNRLNLYTRFCLYSIHMYCFLDFLLPCIAAAGGVLGMEMEPQFDKPYLASSLRDFWGRRWNLMVSAILRPSVYETLRGRLGVPAGVVATFLVSGLMHEVMLYYLSLRPGTGEMTAFFALHGVCTAAEGWCERRWAAGPRPPRAVATVMVVGFVAYTAFWLFFPPLTRDGMEETLLEEWAAVAALFGKAARQLLRDG